jgi:hypothetical protein
MLNNDAGYGADGSCRRRYADDAVISGGATMGCAARPAARRRSARRIPRRHGWAAAGAHACCAAAPRGASSRRDTCARAHTHRHARARVCAQAHTHTHTHAQTHTHTLTHARTIARERVRSCALTHTHLRTHTHTRARASAQALTHARTHARTHTYTHARARARTYARVLPQVQRVCAAPARARQLGDARAVQALLPPHSGAGGRPDPSRGAVASDRSRVLAPRGAWLRRVPGVLCRRRGLRVHSCRDRPSICSRAGSTWAECRSSRTATATCASAIGSRRSRMMWRTIPRRTAAVRVNAEPHASENAPSPQPTSARGRGREAEGEATAVRIDPSRSPSGLEMPGLGPPAAAPGCPGVQRWRGRDTHTHNSPGLRVGPRQAPKCAARLWLLLCAH